MDLSGMWADSLNVPSPVPGGDPSSSARTNNGPDSSRRKSKKRQDPAGASGVTEKSGLSEQSGASGHSKASSRGSGYGYQEVRLGREERIHLVGCFDE